MKTHAIYYKVADRDATIAFCQKALGLRLLREENAIAVMAGQEGTAPYLVIEESPDYLDNRDVIGPKKHALTSIRTAQDDLLQLLLRQETAVDLYKGQAGYAFKVISPQGDTFLLHSESEIESLSPLSHLEEDTALQADFKGLETVAFSGVDINSPQVERSEQFYQKLFGLLAPLKLQFHQQEGQDLLVANDETRDLAVLSFSVPQVMDLAGLYLAAKSISNEVYLDKKANFLMLKDPSGIEIWLSKYPDKY
ncbi:CppA N-terminal domain-containing protein [Streptococcus sp. DD12]|uniref:CppA N-terminal domain-containing protein n=1 Tax=Streptococcus sp. DD12 TaxID=1777880 RepID=UPI0007959B34|nr:CppA N-terminal domain-containing protein [Streptococcus sp. DD12]KXT75697.1 C3-degrading proteinase [Streptococcus sp. DD12]